MEKAFIFDVWETLVDTPQWDKMLVEDPELNSLSLRAKTDVASKRLLVERFDQAISSGRLEMKAVPGARGVLEQIAQKGHLVAFSSGSNYTNRKLLEGAGFERYFNPLLVLSDADTFGKSKSDPGAYSQLFASIENLGMVPVFFVDNTERNLVAAARAKPTANHPPNLYHFDRNPQGLVLPREQSGQMYYKINNLSHLLL